LGIVKDAFASGMMKWSSVALTRDVALGGSWAEAMATVASAKKVTIRERMVKSPN
jgi:hypothetical protein